MLVKAKDNFQDYGPITRLKKGNLYVVYAIEHGTSSNGNDQYAVLLFDIREEKVIDLDIDPLYFDSDLFDVVADLTQSDRITTSVPVAHGDKTISSFKEWFDDGFYYRAHDWDLEGKDYDVMETKRKEYDTIYRQYLNTRK